MIIVRIAGGLGNQMQQYALYRKLMAAGADRDVKLDTSWFDESAQKGVLAKRELELRFFKDIPLPECTRDERDSFLKRSVFTKALNKFVPGTSRIFEESKMYHPEVFELKDCYIEGYFACEKYYDDILPELQKLFAFPSHEDEKMQKKNEELMQKMDSEKSVSIHIRRGDYLDPENAALFGNISTDEYYESAIKYFTDKYEDAHFYIFTNDPEYARQKYSDTDKFTVVINNTGRNSLLDIELMSHCMGNICANSTFSFWGARLNSRSDKEFVRTFRMRNNQKCDPEKMHEYWKGWILIDRDGKII